METTYSWTEKIESFDAAGVSLGVETKVHTITWTDADAVTYRTGKVQEAQAIMDGTVSVARSNKVADALAVAAALTTGDKALIDYSVNQSKAAQTALFPIYMQEQAKIFPIWFEQASAAADAGLAKDASENAKQMALAFEPLLGATPASGPVYITTAGQYATMSDGQLLSLDATGAIFRDGIKLTGVAAQMVCSFHAKVFAKGKTDNKWWQWNGVGWTALDMTAIDPTIFK